MPTTIQMRVQTPFAGQIRDAANVAIVHELLCLIAIRIAGEYVPFGAVGQAHRHAKHMPFHLLFHLYECVCSDNNDNNKMKRVTISF